jgi:hypothetical protein
MARVRTPPIPPFHPVLCVTALALCASCGPERPSEAPKSREIEETPSEDTLDQLRALGYADASDEPADPSETGVSIWDRERVWPGHNLFTVRPMRRADLVDMAGGLVHSWEGPDDAKWDRSVLLDDGDLLVVVASESVMRLGWNGELRWRLDFSAHHDVAPAPGGRFLVLVDEERSLPEIEPEHLVLDNLVRLISAEGEVLEDLSLVEALAARPDLLELESVEALLPAMDLLHANSLQWIERPDLRGQHPIYEEGNLLVSVRHQDSVVVVDWEERELVWAWGRGEVIGPHDATLLENGNVLLFDNGLGRRWSRVLELDPRSEEIVWEYRAPLPEQFYSSSQGAAQRLPNGNTLITESTQGRTFEVTPGGEIVWQYHSPHLIGGERRAMVNRLHRYESDFVEGLLDVR